MSETTEREALYSAAINCPHEIDSNQIVLHYDPKQPGHNALAQLGNRLAAALPSSEHARHMVAGAASAAGQRDECGMTEVDWKRAEALAYMPRLLDAQIDAIANAMPGGLDGFLKGWGWRQFARQIEDAVLERASPADEMVLDRQVKQWTQERDRLNDLIAHATGAAAGALSDEQSTAYDTIDRFLRNNLDDTNYAEYSAMLDALLAAQPAEPAPTIHEGWTLVRTEVWEELSGKNVPEPAPADRQGVALSVTGDEVRAIVRAAHPGGSDHPSGPDYVMATVAYLNRRASSSRAEVESDDERADMFWDAADPERPEDSIHNVVVEAVNNGASPGDIVEVQRAIRLPDISVRVTLDGKDMIGYELLAAAEAPKQEGQNNG